MDIKRGRLSKILHYVVDEFISAVENSFLPEVINIQKIFYEIVKRKDVITQELKAVALSVNNTFHSESKGINKCFNILKKSLCKNYENFLCYYCLFYFRA